MLAALLTLPLALAQEAPAEPAWTPFEFFTERFVYVPAHLNGEPVEALLDSGAGITTISEELADDLGLPRGKRIQALGVGGPQSARLVQGQTVEVAGFVLRRLDVMVLDFGDIAERIGRPVPMVLGREVFAARVVELDYPAERFRLHDPREWSYEGPGHSLQLVEVGREWAVDGEIEGRPARFLLDTGAGDTLTVFGRYTERHDLLRDRSPRSARLGGGVGGTGLMDVAGLESLTLGGFTLHDVPTAFHRPEEGGVFTTLAGDANLGNAVFGRFRTIFDAPHGRLHLEPGPDPDRPFDRERTGLQVVHHGTYLEVVHIAAGSPAEDSPIQVGDHITAINDEPIGPDYWTGGVYRWQVAAQGTEVTLVYSAGEHCTLALATYY